MCLNLQVCVLSLFLIAKAVAFPSGATVEACDSLLPRHVHTSASPASESPFTFSASASRFYPDSRRRKIKVQIKGAPFKGFFVVALDADTHERIGDWTEAYGMEPVPCSAVTHSDGRPKVAATMIWKPPPDRKSGEVIFLATILESFSSYYTGLMATIPVKKRKKMVQHEKFTLQDTFSSDDLSFGLKNVTVLTLQ